MQKDTFCSFVLAKHILKQTKTAKICKYYQQAIFDIPSIKQICNTKEYSSEHSKLYHKLYLIVLTRLLNHELKIMLPMRRVAAAASADVPFPLLNMRFCIKRKSAPSLIVRLWKNLRFHGKKQNSFLFKERESFTLPSICQAKKD